MAWIDELKRVEAEAAERAADPLREKLKAIMRGIHTISTHSILDLVGLPHRTSSARRIAATMRALGYVPIKSRRLEPAGWRDTVTRGWSRPVRESGSRTSFKGEPVQSLHPNSPIHLNSPMRDRTDEQKDACHVL